MVRLTLEKGDYKQEGQTEIRIRLGGRKYIVGAVVPRNDQFILAPLKWQQISDTAEEQIPFEVMCLSNATSEGHGDRVSLVFGDDR